MANNKIMDKFFDLGNIATQGSPVRKAKFDYNLYWVVFITFICLAINYFRLFSITGTYSYLGWGIIICVFSWFNYWALIAFRGAYLNMKKFYDKPKEEVKSEEKEYAGLFDSED